MVLYIFFFSSFASAMDFETESIEGQQKVEEIKKLQIEKTNQVAQKDRILTFAVSDDGHLAVGFYDESAVNIYNENGDFLYSYRFNQNDRRTYSVEYVNNNLQIVLWSSSRKLITLKDDGESVEVSNIPMTNEFNTYLNEIHNMDSREVNGITYQMRNGSEGLARIFVKGYTQVIKKTALGDTKILVDVTNNANKKVNIMFAGIIIVVIVITCFLLFTTKKKNEEKHTSM